MSIIFKRFKRNRALTYIFCHFTVAYFFILNYGWKIKLSILS